jgi:hypothetical protein
MMQSVLLDFGGFGLAHDLFGKPASTFPDMRKICAFFSPIRLAAAISKTPKRELPRKSGEVA